jgi:general secretion pathway protein K
MTRRANFQHGAAILTALLIVALVAVTASALLAQQSQALTRTEAAVGHAQARLYADTALQWARSMLAEDAKQNKVDHLGEAWAEGIVALPVENATLSGTITDEQGRFNLNNLVHDGKPDARSADIFRKLLETLDLAPDLCNAVIDWIDSDSNTTAPGGAEDLTYLALPSPYRAANRHLSRVEELIRVKGFDSKIVTRLRPFVTALPPGGALTRINLNTAPLEVIAAVLPDLPEQRRKALITERLTRPFKGLQDFKARYSEVAGNTSVNEDLDVASDYFTARIGVSAGNAQIRTMALLHRIDGKRPVIIWQSAL